MSSLAPQPYIVFGYGSLIWKPPPHTISREPGFLKSYVRRFAQSSTDHRGVPEYPGRVITLIHGDDWHKYCDTETYPEFDTVWGVAYTIDPDHAAEVKEYLDHREKQGYTEERVEVWGNVGGKEEMVLSNVIAYVGRPDNPSFMGFEPLPTIAERIWKSEGPSGTNKEYLFNLAKSVRELAPESVDSHLFALEEMVLALDRKD